MSTDKTKDSVPPSVPKIPQPEPGPKIKPPKSILVTEGIDCNALLRLTPEKDTKKKD